MHQAPKPPLIVCIALATKLASGLTSHVTTLTTSLNDYRLERHDRVLDIFHLTVRRVRAGADQPGLHTERASDSE
jgi:hypothetical protein